MVTTIPPVRYQDPEVQKAHTDLYLNSSDRPLYPVLPPGISQEHFDKAIQELVEVLGSKNVFAGEALQDYIDPYEILEPGVERKIPSAAVWYDLPSLLVRSPLVDTNTVHQRLKRCKAYSK